MKRLIPSPHNARLVCWLWLALTISSCEDSFMKQSTANKMGAVANLQTTLDDSGNFVAQIDPTKTETQLMRITEGAIAGAAVAIPPAALSIPVSIMVGEGVALTTNSFSQDLGLTGNKIAAGGPSVSFTASQDVVASNPLTLSIPFGALAFALADVDTENLVVMYRWMSLKDGEPSYEVGVIPGDKVTRGQNKVSFQTTKFGTFQVGIAETKITKTLLATTEEPPALKSCERYAAAVYPTCTSDGQVGCVTTESFKAADLSLAKSEFILAGKTMASVTGSVTLPDSGKVLKDTTYGAGGTEKTGNLTLPDPGKVLASSGTYGDPTSPRTPTLPDKGVWDLKTTFSGEGYYSGVSNTPTAAIIASGTTVLGINVPPSPTVCSVDGGASCLVDGSIFKAAKLDSFNSNDILSGKTIAGVQGNALSRPANCSTDGEFGCVVVGPSFAAADKTVGAESKIIRGQQVGGISGNVTLPAVGDVRQGLAFGSNGSLTGNLSTGSPLSSCSTDNQTNCIANTNYPSVNKLSIENNTNKFLNSLILAGVTGSLSECSANGSDCYLPAYAIGSKPLKSINFDEIVANTPNIRVNKVVGGVTGSLPDCSDNKLIDCVTTNNYKSFDFANLSSQNIRRGVSVGGVLGSFPSTDYPLDGSNGTDLTSATFNAQMKSSSTFQYFSSDGTRYTGSGVPLDPWDIRFDKTINGENGKLKVSCRNRTKTTTPSPSITGSINTSTTVSTLVINSSNHGLFNGTNVTINFSGSINGLYSGLTYTVTNANTNFFNLTNPNSQTLITYSSSSAAAVSITPAAKTPMWYDIWNTIDDYNGGTLAFPTQKIPSWPESTDCIGLDTFADGDENNIWKDVTTSDGSTPSSCGQTSINCTLQDKITRLWWSKNQPTQQNWDGAWQTCEDLIHNGKTDWRLPTQKELLESYIHGIRSVPGSLGTSAPNWITETAMAGPFWSGTSVSYWTPDNSAWAVSLAKGGAFPNSKITPISVVCVR